MHREGHRRRNDRATRRRDEEIFSTSIRALRAQPFATRDMLTESTQVGIIGAGPAGLMLSHLLHNMGIESVILEARSRSYVEGRVRAGVLEADTVRLLRETGVGERLQREGLRHRGISLRFNGESHRIDFEELTGKIVTVYGQQEVVKDLIVARLGYDGAILFDSPVTSLENLDDDHPRITYTDRDGKQATLVCDFVAGCDGFHGISRPSVPARAIAICEHVFPFAWLGVLAQSPPVSEELIYTYHPRGFALVSMRSPTISRLYLQCRPDEDLAQWPDERFWSELRNRLGSDEGGPPVITGPLVQKGLTAMRSFVAEPMQYGRLFLAGDAAHIVPPTGAKGMNLAIADVRVLANALTSYYRTRTTDLLDTYSNTALRRVWKTQRFSAWMTSMLHQFEHHDTFAQRLQIAELDYVTSSRTAARLLAENYVGLPFS
jgi:p-hydroxybenzoate 3-monooxygenase